MEKDGWLDQRIADVLDVLSWPWLGLGLAFFGAMAVAYLAGRSSKSDVEYLREGAGKVLFGVFLLSAALRSVPRFVAPEYVIDCDWTVDELGTPSKDCRFETSGVPHFVADYSFVDMLRDFVVASLQEAVVAGVGYLIGRGIATAWAARPPT